jgi:hypothetical protein
MARMQKRYQKMFRRIIAIMATEPDYEMIDEIRILNDGGGTGTWHVSIKPAGKKIRGANIAMRDPLFDVVELTEPDEYYIIDEGNKEYC